MQKTLAIRSAAVLACTAGLWLAYTQQPPAAALTLEKVKDDLYNISGDGGNVAVLVSPDAVLLVDDKFERDFANIMEKVKSVSDKPVKYILNTHHHGDHTGGNARFLTSAEIVSHKNARANIVTNKQPGAPRITFTEEASVYLGAREVRAHYFGRGHTNGDAAIYFPDLKVVHTGDLFPSGAPFVDYAGGGSVVEWTQTIDRIMAWDFDTVIPGHGPVAKRADLLKWRNNLETMRTRMSDLKKQGKSKEEAGKALKIDDLGWKPSPLFDRSLGGMYDELSK